MIPLAVNDTAVSRRAWSLGLLDVEFVETSGALADDAPDAFEGAAFLLHNAVWNVSLAHADLTNVDGFVERTVERIRHLRAPWISLHLGFSAREVTFDGGMKPVTPTLGRDEALSSIVASVRTLQDRLEVPLLLENLDDQAGGAYEHVCRAEFVRDVIDGTDAGLLLDLAHAAVSASRQGRSLQAYVDDLPLDRVRQIHVSGPRREAGVAWDAHDTLLDEDVEALRRLLDLTEPWALTLEYGRDQDALVAQLEVLRQLTSA